LTPKSFFRSLISWARAMSASENVNSPADSPGMSHSSRIHISSADVRYHLPIEFLEAVTGATKRAH